MFTQPRSAGLQWLVGSKGVDRPDQRQRLISNLFTRMTSVLMAAASELIVAVAALLRHPTAAFDLWVAGGVFVLVARLTLLTTSKHAAAAGRPTPTSWVVVASLVWAAEVGVGCLLCDLSGDTALQVLSNVCVTAILGALIARNASTPRLALAQMLIALSLLCLGAALAPQHWLRILLLQAPLYALGLANVCFRINGEIVAMLEAHHANATLARTDSLTGLPNRVHVKEALQARLSGPGAERPFAILCIDLDGFKTVNDALGHAAGDAVLAETGRRLCATCGPATLVARLGGDEFLLILPEGRRAEAEALAAAVGVALKAPYVLPDAPAVRLDVSIGVALHPDHGGDLDALMLAAEKALYAVKAAGRAHYAVYDAARHAGEGDMILLRADLEEMLRTGRDGLELHYQPVARLADGQMIGREALVRWRHPVRGLLSPDIFIPMAEASGLIVPLGERVLRQACADAASWGAPVKVAVNVSPVQLRNERLALTVARALSDAALPADRLELEVTETVLLDDDAMTSQNMRRIRTMGVDVVLDDFGTGFSSLSNLCRFAFDRIKIDGSFVREALDRRECAAVIRATVQLARELDIPTTAECIETREQLDFVRACGCTDVQGYLLGRPVPLTDIAGAHAKSTKAKMLSAA